MTEAQRLKKKAMEVFELRLQGKRQMIEEIDPRLWEYFEHISCNTSANPDDGDEHNIYEVLSADQFLRMLATYPFNKKKVQTVIRLREGEWVKDGKVWRHVRGGLKCPGTSGAQYYRWQPFQVFVLACVFGFMSWVNTQVPAGTKSSLLPTEREKDGFIYDYRRVCTEFVYYGPRKTDKTGLAAYIQFIFFFFEDDNAETYCCANSSDQAKLLFSRTRQLIAQMDDGQRIRSTQTVIDWKDNYKTIRDTSVRPLSAGGKTKDGMFAQLCCADEFGSAPYTNGKSDMLSLVNVIQSSMGPRREPMTFITTTAGTITNGPFIDKLETMHRQLLLELTFGDGTRENIPEFENDRRLCLCLEPDEWECDEEVILTKKSLRRKVNPMLGLIVQHSSYDGWISEARNDHNKMAELKAKYFNHYSSGTVTEWMKSDKIRPLQIDRRVTDCKMSDGWTNTFVGLDFSHGDDLFDITYLSVDYRPSNTMAGRFFADCDVWILEAALLRSPNRPLFEKWIEQGWLNVCPGEAFNPDYAINKLMEKTQQGVNLAKFGFDPAQSKQPINTLKAWLQTLGINGPTIEQMVVPVSQTAMTFNPIIHDIEDWINAPEPWIQFSMSPLWPWCFGNCRVEFSRNDLRRVVKASPSEKIDPVHGLIDAVHCFTLAESRV